MSTITDTKVLLSKLTAFINVQSKGRFEIPETLIGEVYAALQQFAEKNRIQITVTRPDIKRTQLYSLGGALAGGAVGYRLASVPGALAGAVIGYGAGYALAHVTITVTPKENSDFVILELT